MVKRKFKQSFDIFSWLKKKRKRAKTARRFWLAFVALPVLFILAVFLLLYPFLPGISFRLGLVGKSDDAAFTLESLKRKKDISQENILVIPKIDVNIKIVEGETQEALDQGAWRMPTTSTPDKGGNTVISAHRFKYLPPNNATFYLLDKLSRGDRLFVYWQGKEYEYVVVESKVVEPTEISILDNTPDNRLTLFTCTPLFTTDKRLVVIGALTK
ncbi:MAG: sortase [Patescibacteria group bacterium]|nr:sortase [Patescibacteria group bacterium]